MGVAVAILMKHPARAKSRLGAVLCEDGRRALALRLFEDTLVFFAGFRPGRPLGVVTPSAHVAALARGYGAAVIDDDGDRGINGAADRAAAWAKRVEARSLLVVHADIAVLVEAEFARLLEAGERRAVVIGASGDGGTNALLQTPSAAVPFCYGAGSALAHAAAARERGLSVATLTLPGLSRDIDTPGDLARFPNLVGVAARESRPSVRGGQLTGATPG